MSQSRRGGRSRIVIDVAQAQAEAEARRRGGGRRRRVLSTAALAGFLWWRSYQKGPAYSLALLLDAARSQDARAVEQYVEAEAVAQGFIPQVIEKLTGEGSAVVPPHLRGQLGSAMPQVIQRVREGAHEEVMGALRQFAEGVAGSTPTPLVALGVSRAAEIEQQGDAARVVVRREERTTELTMRREGDRWRVTGMKDDELAASLAARVAAGLPQQPQPQPQNAPRRRQGR